jgi:hypothetical protein
MSMSCGWFGGERLCARRARHLAAVAVFLMFPAATWPQDATQDTPDTPVEARGLPSGLRVNSVSAWVGRSYLPVPIGSGTLLDNYTLGYGGGLDAGLFLPGRTGRASLDYRLGYNGNLPYGELNGFDHSLFFSWRRILTRTLSLYLTGTAETVTVAGYLFQPFVSSPADLSSTGTLSGSLTQVTTPGATQTILYPGRRQTATMAATVSYAVSGRFNWHVSMRGQRLLPSNSHDSGAQEGVGYPGETEGGAGLGLTYSLSRRTSFGADINYSRTMSPLGKTQAASGGLTVTRVLSRRWFGSATAGYGLGNYFVAISHTNVSHPDFTGRAVLATSFDGHTLSLAAAQRIGDSYGFGAHHTMDGSLAWIWHPKQQKWSFQAAGSYERLNGGQVDKIQSAVFRGTVARRLTRTLSCTVEGGYAWGVSNKPATSLEQRTQQGARLSLVWRPAGTLW